MTELPPADPLRERMAFLEVRVDRLSAAVTALANAVDSLAKANTDTNNAVHSLVTEPREENPGA